MKKLILFTLLGIAGQANAITEKYRLMFRDDPAHTMVIGWSKVGGVLPINPTRVYYGTEDKGTNITEYPMQHGVDRAVFAQGMYNEFARLTGLKANTVYYFVVSDATGNSQRFSFKTLPDNPNIPLSIIAGGDSRATENTADGGPRVEANKMVTKIRPDVILFSGDYTDFDTPAEWAMWLDDWQLTIAEDGRMFPLINTRGNHEYNASTTVDIFDVPNTDSYYAITFGSSLLRTYTLNTEIAQGGDQAAWLADDLSKHGTETYWRFANYHRCIRPHESSKADQEDAYQAWAPLFYDYKFQIVIESDAHVVKSTYPIRPTMEAGHDNGYVRDDANGSVYIGEGCWGAPVRTADRTYSWTRAAGEFNMYHWMMVSKDKIEIKYVMYDNVDEVSEVDPNNRFAVPAGMQIWEPANGSGSTLVIENPTSPATFIKAKKMGNAQALLTPNPVKNTATLHYSISSPQVVKIAIYDFEGRLVRSLSSQKMPIGSYQLNINTSDLAPGNYMVGIFGENLKQGVKLTKIK
jgi:hypothetical protein